MFSFCVLMRFGGVWLPELLELWGWLLRFTSRERTRSWLLAARMDLKDF